jgi:hypothetical protein
MIKVVDVKKVVAVNKENVDITKHENLMRNDEEYCDAWAQLRDIYLDFKLDELINEGAEKTAVMLARKGVLLQSVGNILEFDVEIDPVNAYIKTNGIESLDANVSNFIKLVSRCRSRCKDKGWDKDIINQIFKPIKKAYKEAGMDIEFYGHHCKVDEFDMSKKIIDVRIILTPDDDPWM